MKYFSISVPSTTRDAMQFFVFTNSPVNQRIGESERFSPLAGAWDASTGENLSLCQLRRERDALVVTRCI